MKPCKLIILAVLMTASLPFASAQGWTNDPKSIVADTDFVLGDGTRCVSATPFLVHEDTDYTIVMDVVLFIPEGGGFNDFEWTLEMRVRYDNPSFKPIPEFECDLTTEFVKENVLVAYVGMSKALFTFVENGRLNVRREKYAEFEWLVASYTFDEKRLFDRLCGNVQPPDRLVYTQGKSSPRIMMTVEVGAEQFALPVCNSVVAIYHKLSEE